MNTIKIVNHNERNTDSLLWLLTYNQKTEFCLCYLNMNYLNKWKAETIESEQH